VKKDATNQVAARLHNKLIARIASHQAIIQKKSSSTNLLDKQIVAGRQRLLEQDIIRLNAMPKRKNHEP
jgi:hypothetical protein